MSGSKRNHLRGKRLSKELCPVCNIKPVLCICEHRPQVSLSTRVTVIMHVAETKLTSNTAKLLRLALTNSEILLRGDKDAPLDLSKSIDPSSTTLFLYPSADAKVLDAGYIESLGKKPIQLIVADGNWNQASRVAKREPLLAGVPHVTLPPGPPSRYRLRSEPNPNYLCTYEAVLRALDAIESHRKTPGWAKSKIELDDFFDLTIERILWSRAKIKASETRFPIPNAAKEEFLIAGRRGSVRK